MWLANANSPHGRKGPGVHLTPRMGTIAAWYPGAACVQAGSTGRVRLDIAASLRVVTKHRHMNVSVPAARDCIQCLAVSRVTREDELLVDDLERATGMPIAELAKLSEKWLPKE